jgi:S1-C subfamily serine protease
VGLPEREGILVREVEREGPAAAAGIQEGDLIVEVGGRPVRDADTLLDVLSASSWPLEVRIVRGTDERTVSVAGEAPAKG